MTVFSGSTGVEFQQFLDNLPNDAEATISPGTVIVTSAPIGLSKPIRLKAYGVTIRSNHNSQYVILIKSDKVEIHGLNVIGSGNENAIQIDSYIKQTKMVDVTTTQTLIGFSTKFRAEDLIIQRSAPRGNVHGIILRTPKNVKIENCDINDHSGIGHTGIRIQGYERRVEEIITTNNSIRITNHQLQVGDRVRFYSNNSIPILPTGLLLDHTYEIASQGFTSNTFTLSRGGVVVPLSGNFSGINNLIMVVTAQDISITNCRMNNNRAGINCIHTDKSRFFNNKIKNGTCIQLENSWDNVISSNTVSEATDLGINLHRNSSYNKISLNYCNYCTNAGIGLTVDIQTNIANNNYNKIIGNHCVYSRSHPNHPIITGHGIELNNSGVGNILSGNHCMNNSRNGIRVGQGMTETTLQGNFIQNNNAHGLRIENDDVLIVGNRILNNGQDGVNLITNIHFVQIIGNRIKSNGGWGIYLSENTLPIVITGNTINANLNGHIRVPNNVIGYRIDTINNILFP